MKLIEPTEEHCYLIDSYKSEFIGQERIIPGSGSLENYDSVLNWLSDIKMKKCYLPSKGHLVPSTQYIYLDENSDKIIGMIQLRHYLNEFLLKYAGHVGYSICPDERRKGYATSMLHDALEVYKKMGINRVLISCASDNEASRKVIKKNGGVFDSTVYYEKEQIYLEKFWINNV